jgi:uncharacterized membrane protein
MTDDELTPEQRFAAEDAETMVPRALLLGKSPDDVVADLVKLDYSVAAARTLVERVMREMQEFNESPESRKRLIDGAFKQFIGGLIATVIVAAITIPAMIFATAIAWAFALVPVILFGATITMTGRGWARWRLYRGWEQRYLERENR